MSRHDAQVDLQLTPDDVAATDERLQLLTLGRHLVGDRRRDLRAERHVLLIVRTTDAPIVAMCRRVVWMPTTPVAVLPLKT